MAKTAKKAKRTDRPEVILIKNCVTILQQEVLHLYGVFAEFVRGQRNGLPFRAANLHIPAIDF